jgi:hypothetical protein
VRILLTSNVGQGVLRGRNVRESVKTHGGDVVKDFAEQGARSKEQGLVCVKRGMDAREDEVNVVICHLINHL